MDRNQTRIIKVGNVLIGGGNPISVQTMTKSSTADVEQTIYQIEQAADYGCDIIRVAVPDVDAAESLKDIVKKSPIPLVADIHFNYRLAIMALESGVQKIRLNPGNLKDKDAVKTVAELAKKLNVPIRIGVNGGSIGNTCNVTRSDEFSEKERYSNEIIKAAEYHINLLKEIDFENIIVSLKSSDITSTIDANVLFSKKYDFPLHIGLTEAGCPPTGLIKSTIAISEILKLGIGDTVRVSLTADPAEEVVAGIEMLKSLKLRFGGINYISCPTCGRCDVELMSVIGNIKKGLFPLHKKLEKEQKEITIAIMGCEVNGPGEAANADYGVACGKNGAIIFSHGEKKNKVTEKEITRKLIEIISYSW